MLQTTTWNDPGILWCDDSTSLGASFFDEAWGAAGVPSIIPIVVSGLGEPPGAHHLHYTCRYRVGAFPSEVGARRDYHAADGTVPY